MANWQSRLRRLEERAPDSDAPAFAEVRAAEARLAARVREHLGTVLDAIRLGLPIPAWPALSPEDERDQELIRCAGPRDAAGAKAELLRRIDRIREARRAASPDEGWEP